MEQSPASRSPAAERTEPARVGAANTPASKNYVIGLIRKAAWRKHSLALQLATAKILALTNALTRKERELSETRRRTESLANERSRLFVSLRRVTSELGHAEERERNLRQECSLLESHIQSLRQGQYMTARAEVEALRNELPEPVQLPPDLQSQIDDLLASLSSPPSDERTQGEEHAQNGLKHEEEPTTRAATPRSVSPQPTTP